MPTKVPDPPADLKARVNREHLASGSRLVRCFNAASHTADAFNNGFGAGGRFHFFHSVRGTRVGVLYAADSFASAVSETIFHDVPLRGRRFVAGHKLTNRCIIDIEVTAGPPLALVQLHDPGLSRLGLRPENLTSTSAAHYARTCRWAEAIHRDVTWAQGLVWMSARYNSDKAMVLFEDRIDPARLVVDPATCLLLDSGPGLALVRELGRDSGIVVSTPRK